jgi:hypothetical protein
VTFSLGLFSQNPITASILVLFLLIALTISSYFASQRLKQKRARLTAVITANAIAVFMVVGLAFDIQITGKQTPVVYLVTNGITAQLLEKIDTEQAMFVMGEAVKSAASNNILDVATLIDTPSQMLSKRATFNNLHVLGDGLSSTQWQDLQRLMGQAFNNISVTFSASKPRIGLTNMQWPRELAVGQFVEIKGQLQPADDFAADKIYQLSLLDPADQIVETIRLKASERFTFNFPAKTTGQWVYRLQLKGTNDTTPLTNEPVAFSVVKPVPLRILIKQSAPSFETRQLKNWATSFGSQISVLTQISQNKDIRQNINLNAKELDQIASPFVEQALDNVDWLVIDGRALLTLTVQQMAALKTATEKGLGIYIMADNELVKAWPVPSLEWLADIDIQPLETANYSSIPIWRNSKVDQAIPLVKANITAANDSFLVNNNKTQILVSQSKVGLGQVAVSLINSTYGWQTAGLTEQYSHYWQSIVYVLARPKQTPYWLNTEPDSLTLVNQPEQRCLLSATDAGVTSINQNPQPLILTQDLLQKERHCLTIWSAKNGWSKLNWSVKSELPEESIDKKASIDSWLYTYTEQDWSQWQQTQKHRASQNIAQQQNTKLLEKQSVKSLDKAWFWALLVLSMSLLWLERKLF